jgi:hypothetical protein
MEAKFSPRVSVKFISSPTGNELLESVGKGYPILKITVFLM